MNTTAPKGDLILGAAAYGGGFPLFWNAVTETINETDRSLSVIPRNTAGSAENIGFLDAGKLDIALVTAELAYGLRGYWPRKERPRDCGYDLFQPWHVCGAR